MSCAKGEACLRWAYTAGLTRAHALHTSTHEHPFNEHTHTHILTHAHTNRIEAARESSASLAPTLPLPALLTSLSLFHPPSHPHLLHYQHSLTLPLPLSLTLPLPLSLSLSPQLLQLVTSRSHALTRSRCSHLLTTDQRIQYSTVNTCNIVNFLFH